MGATHKRVQWRLAKGSNLMKRALICTGLMVLMAGVAIAHRGPYTVNTDTSQLVQIDPGYQSMTPVADLPYGIDAIEYSTDGFIYGVSAAADTLIKVDPNTGSVEVIGPLGIDLDWHADLDEDDQGTLWMLEGEAGGLYTIDRATGTAVLQCQADFPYISGLAIADGKRWTTRFDWPNPPQEPAITVCPHPTSRSPSLGETSAPPAMIMSGAHDLRHRSMDVRLRHKSHSVTPFSRFDGIPQTTLGVR